MRKCGDSTNEPHTKGKIRGVKMLIKKEEECYFSQMNFVAYCESCRKRFVVYEVDHRNHAENCGESVICCPFCGCIFTRKIYNNEKEDLLNEICKERKRLTKKLIKYRNIIRKLNKENNLAHDDINYLLAEKNRYFRALQELTRTKYEKVKI